MHPSEWEEEVYSHPAKDQFLREGEKLATGFLELLTSQAVLLMDSKQAEKAITMIYSDLFMSIKDCCFLLQNNKYRLVGPILREFIELKDIAYCIREHPNKFLERWYDNVSPNHNEIRQLIGKNLKEVLDEASSATGKDPSLNREIADFYKSHLKSEYSSISKLTHKTYKTLLYNYWTVSIDDDSDENKLILDQTGILNSSKTIFLTLLSHYTIKLLNQIKEEAIFTPKQFEQVLRDASDSETFKSGPCGDPETIKKDFGFNPLES